MADEHDQDEKTEAASAKRLQQAYEQGQVPVGRDAVGVVALIAAVVTLSAMAPALRDRLIALVAGSVQRAHHPSFADLQGPLLGAAAPFAFAMLAAAAAALIATLAQTRGGFWPELAMPDLSRISGARFKRLFSLELVTDTALSAAKALTVGVALWLSLRGDARKLTQLLTAPAGVQLSTLFDTLAGAGLRTLAALAALAGADLALQQLRFRKRLRMTREEMKREHKEEEGDPLLKSRRKRRHRDLMKGIAKVEVPKADALVVNPTHVAVAIRYRRDEGKSPKVTAKGKGELAEHMRELARSNGIPIVQDIPLARALYKRVKVGREIPADLFKGVAAVLAFVYRVTGRSTQQRVRG